MRRCLLLLIATGATYWSIRGLSADGGPGQLVAAAGRRRLEAEVEGASSASLHKEVNALESEVQELKLENEELKSENEELRSDLENTQSELDAVKKDGYEPGDSTTAAAATSTTPGEEGAQNAVSEHAEELRDVRQWHWASWVSLVLVALCCCCGQSLCLAVFSVPVFDLESSLYNDLMSSRSDSWSYWSGYAPLDDSATDDSIELIIKREMRLMLLCPLLAIVAFPWTTCEDGMPTWAYILYVPLLLRAKWIEYRILQHVGKNSFRTFLSVGFILGTLEHADFFTDGAFPLQSALCEPDATDLFAESFSQSWAWPLAPVIALLRLWGLLIMVLVASVFTQQISINVAGGGYELISFAAEVPGMGAVAEHYQGLVTAADTNELKRLVVLFSRVFLENLIQLWLQSSYFGLVFSRVSDDARAKLLLSICLGLASAVFKTGQSVVTAYVSCVSGNGEAQRFNMMIFAFSFLSFLVSVWVGLKLYYSYSCPSHLWNMTSGCVVL